MPTKTVKEYEDCFEAHMRKMMTEEKRPGEEKRAPWKNINSQDITEDTSVVDLLREKNTSKEAINAAVLFAVGLLTTNYLTTFSLFKKHEDITVHLMNELLASLDKLIGEQLLRL